MTLDHFPAQSNWFIVSPTTPYTYPLNNPAPWSLHDLQLPPPPYTPFPQLPYPPTTSCISEQWASPHKSATCKVTRIPAKDGKVGDSVPACSSLGSG